jgi:hypothetical protein
MMSTQEKLRQLLDSGETIALTFSNQNPLTSHGESVQKKKGRLVSTNSPDVVEFQPLDGAPVPIPVSRILTIETESTL